MNSDDRLNAAEQLLCEKLRADQLSAAEEVEVVERIVKIFGSGRLAAEFLGRSEQWVSKRMRIAKAPQFVLDHVKESQSRDIDVFYLLARLAKRNEPAARAYVNTPEGEHLRERLGQKNAGPHPRRKTDPGPTRWRNYVIETLSATPRDGGTEYRLFVKPIASVQEAPVALSEGVFDIVSEFLMDLAEQPGGS